MLNNLEVELVATPLFEEALDLCSDGILILNSSGVITYGNRKISKDIGLSCKDFLGKEICFLHKCNYISSEVFNAIANEVKENGNYEGEIKRKDITGQIVWENIRVTSKTNEDGKVFGFLVVIKDITSKKQFEAGNTYMCREHYNCVFKDSHLNTLLIEPETGKIIEANEVACDFYGYSFYEIREKYIWEINCLDKEEVLKNMRKVIDTVMPGSKKSKQFNFQHRLSDGTIKDVEVNCGMINMHGRKLVYSVVFDISDRKRAERLLQESEEKYRVLVELSPEAIIVYRNGKILYGNAESRKYAGLEEQSNLSGNSILDFVREDYHALIQQLSYRVQHNKEIINNVEFKLTLPDGRYFDVDAYLSPIQYEGKEAGIALIRDITEKKKEMERALRVQDARHRIKFPLREKAIFENVYIPASGLSGDFFHLHRVDDERVIGIIGDVSGKGISAALSISALKVLFYDRIGHTSDPLELLKYMNTEVARHLYDEYVAACCFLLDFSKGQAIVASAGINQFIIKRKCELWKKHVVEGPFLGMFERCLFEKKIYNFDSGDTFYFYSDGADFIFDVESLSEEYSDMSLSEFRDILNDTLNKTIIRVDDFTWLGIEIK